MTALLVSLAACGASTITDPSNNADAPFTSGGPDGPLVDARVTCGSAIECAVGTVCNPATSRCVANLACARHTDCGKQAYCQPNGTCAVNILYGPCDTTDNCVGGETCVGTHCGCGGVLLAATAVPPNILIALDRSQSMNTEVGNTGMSRWQVAQVAMKNIAKKYENAIRFGLVLWPGNSKSCTVSENDCQGVNNAVPLGFGNGDAIGAYLDTAGRCSLGTPIGNSLTVLGSYAGLDDTTRPNYIMLVTDGQEQNCNGNGPAAATTLRQHTPEIKTFAVGFGGEVDTAVLTAIATNGGTARAGTPKYYQADNQAQLETAFDNIAGSVVACDYTLSSEPNDPNRLSVYLGTDTTPIPRDMTHATGWDYNATTKRLTFYGATCDQIRTGSRGALSVVFGCTVIP
jgi:hypothetical protein